MRLCLVTSYPPHKARLSEYAYQLVKELDKLDKIKEINVLADAAQPSIEKQGQKTTIYRLWKPDYPFSILGIVVELLRCKPDVVHFNLHFFSMGNSRVANIVGLCLIPFCRLIGFKVVATFHHLGINQQGLEELGIKKSFLNQLGLSLGYFLVSKSNIVVGHVKNLRSRLRNLVYIPHGTNPEEPTDPKEDSNSTILFFGVLSPYKGVEYLIEAFKKTNDPNLRLIITNSPHPRFPYYSYKIRKIAENDKRITLVDYIPEAELPSFFSNGDITVFPYVSNTGTSGAFHTVASFGKATIMSDLPVFRELIEEGAGGLLFRPRDVNSLVECLDQLISNPGLVQEIKAKNLAFSRSRTWHIVAKRYLQVYSKILKDLIYEG